MFLNPNILILCILLFQGCLEGKKDSDSESTENSATKPVVSQRSTGAISPFASKDQVVDSKIFVPEQDLVLSVWKSRMTLPKGSYSKSLQVTFSMISGGTTTQTPDLQVVSPMVELKINDLEGKIFERTLLEKYIKIETIVDRFIEAKSTVALVTLAYGSSRESRWLIIPEELSVRDLEDGSKMVTFYMRDTDFAYSVAASRTGKPSNGYAAFKSAPRESRNMVADATSTLVSDEASQVKLTWTAVDGSRTGYKIEYGYEPIATSACVKGKPIDPTKITKIRQNFPAKSEDSFVLTDLNSGSTLYLQLCSTNSREPPDVSPGLDFVYDVPKRVKAELKGLPALVSNSKTLDVAVGGKDVTHYKFVLQKNAQECGKDYSEWISISEKIRKDIDESPYLLCVLGKSGDKNQQKIPVMYGFITDLTQPYPFTIDSVITPTNQVAPTVTINGGENVSGSTHAKYVVATDASCAQVYFASQVPTPTLQLPTLIPGTYYLCVTAIDQAANEQKAANNGLQLVVDTQVPLLDGTPFVSTDSPAGSPASYDDDLSVYLNWAAAQDIGDAGLESFSLERYSSADCSGIMTLTEGISSTATYSLVVLPAEGVYTFKLRVKDRAGNQTLSSCTSSITIDTTAPTVVATQLKTTQDSAAGIDARYDDDTTIFMAWNAAEDNPGGTGIYLYQIFAYSQAACAGSAITINTGTSRSYEYAGLLNGSTYSFKVRAIDFAGNIGQFSSCSGNIMIDTTAPSSATNLREAASVGGGADVAYDLDGTIYLSWDAGSDGAGSGVESYEMEVFTQGSCLGTGTKTSGLSPATLSQVFTGSHNTTYSFQVRAYDFAGNSTLSACSNSVYVDLEPPDAFNLTTAPTTKDRTPEISWGVSDGALNYTLKIDDQNDCLTPTQTVTGITTEVSELAAIEDGTWYICVTAFDASGHETNATNNGSSFVLNSGSWSAVTTGGVAPSARYEHTAVWNSNQSEVIVWGGTTGGSYLNDGGRYNPATDSWQTITAVDAPSVRQGHIALWDSNIERMIVWGGSDGVGSYLDSGGIYQSGGAWTPISLVDQPVPRTKHTAVWTGSQTIIWGGYGCTDPPVCGTLDYLQSGGLLDNGTNTWTMGGTDTADGDLPAARSDHTAVWTGTRMIVWGGESASGLLQSGGIFNPSGGGGGFNWLSMTTVGAPSPRKFHTAVWDSTSNKMIIWGGYGCTNPPTCTVLGDLADGGIYDPSLDSWTQVSQTQSPAARRNHVAVWNPDDEVMVLWGGFDGTNYLGTGAILDLATGVGGTWIVPSMRTTGAPTLRSKSASVWTGSKFFVYGGTDGAAVAGGGLYTVPP